MVEPTRKIPVLLVLDGLFHPSLIGRLGLERFFRGQAGFQFKKVASLEALPEMDPAAFQAMVLYFHHEKISPAALDAFENHVRAGCGVIAVHSASASFKQSPRYYDVLGGQFVRHGPIGSFDIQPVGASPLLSGIPGFAVRDELYRHEFDPANTVHFSVEVDGMQEPVVWTRQYGAGRVFYLSLGHRAEVLRNQHTQEILRRGLRWACGERPD